MKKFIGRTVVFVLLMWALDTVIGLGCRYLTTHAKSGDTARNYTIVNRMDADIVLFGSSRCIHHYDPRILSDSLHATCYNCGSNGMGIILFYAYYRMMTERYKPKVVIYDILPGFDLLKSDNYSYLSWLRPYYDHNGIDSLFWTVSTTERYKMMSQMYRYNGKILQMITDNVVTIREEHDGYRPMDGELSYDIDNDIESVAETDSLKMYYMERLIESCKINGTQLIFTVSPLYKSGMKAMEAYKPLYLLAEKHEIPVLNHFTDTAFINDKTLFWDSFHMNRKGAERYTRTIVKEIKFLGLEI